MEAENTFESNENPTPSAPASSSRLVNTLDDTNASILNNSKLTTTPIPRSTTMTSGLKLNLNNHQNRAVGFSNANSDQALLSAIYNTIAIALLVICVALCALLFAVLQAFVRSILWALLTSACLFAAKKYLTDLARNRLSLVETSGSTLALEFAVLPMRLIDSAVDWTWQLMQRRYRYLLALFLTIVLINLGRALSYGAFASSFIDTAVSFFSTLSRFSNLMTYYADNMWFLTCTLVISYALALTFYWNETHTTLFQIISLPVWSSLLFLISRLMGSYRPLFLFAIGCLIMLGIYSFLHEYFAPNKRKILRSDDDSTANEDDLIENIGSLNDNETNKVLDTSHSQSASILKTTILNLYQTSIYYLNNSPSAEEKASDPAKTNSTAILRRSKENSDTYFIILFWLFICVKLRYDFYILIPFVVIIWKLLKHALQIVIDLIKSSRNFELAKNWLQQRREILAPRPFLIIIKLFRKGDHKFIQLISGSMDTIVTALIMFSLILAVVCSTIILCIQVQSESTQLITIGSNILNDQLYAKPEWHQWLPEKERLNKLYHSSMKNFHIHGREWLSRSLKSIDNPQNANNSDYLLLEAQILEQWDRLYAYLSHQSTNSFNMTNNYSNLAPVSVPPKIILPVVQNSSHRTIGTQTTNGPWYWSNYMHLAIIVKDNLGVFMSIVDSLYQIFRGNLNLVTTILWTLISTVFSSGFALANFLVSFLVYMTAVFYLLSSARYKPLQWISEFRLLEQHHMAYGLSKAIEDSIRSVFVASLKMAAFYGIYTYTINCLFSVSIIYLPSILAALFAFLPLLGTYWIAVPGLLELWLVQNRPIAAVLFTIAHLMPSIVAVDKAIYSEIKAGHPYLTGLAFAGGVYCLGFEGALIGPIVLCLLIVIGKMITKANLSEQIKSYQFIRTPSAEN